MSTLWTPAEITTALWLDADDSSTLTLDGSGNVEQWNDKSGNAYNGTQSNAANRPGLSSSEVTFSDDFLSASDAMVASSVSVFLVARSTNTDTARIIDAKGGSASSADSGGLMLIQSAVASSGLSWTVSNGGSVNRLNSGTENEFRGQNTDAIVAAFYDNASGRQWIEVNATLKSEAFPGSGLLDRSTSVNELRIGNSITDASPLLGGIKEIILVSSAVGLSDRQLIEGYLAHKWGLAAKLPADHPYKSAAPTIPSDPTSTSTGEVTGTGTGTGTGSTGAPQLLTPLDIFLVSMSLPDEPAVEPEPEPADVGRPEVGELWEEEGGYLGAYISVNADGVATHALIVSPKSTESDQVLGTSITADDPIDGPGNTAALVAAGSAAATYVDGLTTNGKTDWYLPSIYELCAIYWNLKPSAFNNISSTSTLNPENPWSVPQRGRKTSTEPVQTSSAIFQASGGQDFRACENSNPALCSLNELYWSSNKSSSVSGRFLSFGDGAHHGGADSAGRRVRAIRRVAL